MITFKKLLERAKSERIAVHTPTEEQAIALLEALDKKGYEWRTGTKLTTKTYYKNHKQNTCYNFDFDLFGEKLGNKVLYCSLDCYQELNFTIIEFSDIDFTDKKNPENLQKLYVYQRKVK